MKLYEPAPPARKDELANVQDGIAVIVDGDTCPVVVESGMYAYIKNNTHGLAEGLYKNTSDSAFPTSGGTADGTVFEADGTGGLNALNASTVPWYDCSSHTEINSFPYTVVQNGWYRFMAMNDGIAKVNNQSVCMSHGSPDRNEIIIPLKAGCVITIEKPASNSSVFVWALS